MATTMLRRHVARSLAVTGLLITSLATAAAGQRSTSASTPDRLVGAPAASDDAAAFVRFVANLVDPFWAALFKAEGKPYRSPRLVITDEDVPSACGTIIAAGGPAYCPADTTVFVQPGAFTSTHLGRELMPGDFGPAYVIAHEWGHHVQSLYGLEARRAALIARAGSAGAQAVRINYELQADCFAGVWARDVYGQGRLEPGDIEEAQTSASRVGDDALHNDDWGHGSAADRLAWFTYGLQTGNAAQCRLDPPRTAPITIGAYLLTVPAGWTARQLGEGIIELRSTSSAVPTTVQLAARRIDFGVASPAPAVNYLEAEMRLWNQSQPMEPVAEAQRIDEHAEHLGGSAATQPYEQVHEGPQGQAGLIHGAFTLHVGSSGQAIAIDVFAVGSAAQAGEAGWQRLAVQTLQILRQLSTR